MTQMLLNTNFTFPEINIFHKQISFACQSMRNTNEMHLICKISDACFYMSLFTLMEIKCKCSCDVVGFKML